MCTPTRIDVHMQKPDKQKGKKGKIVPLVTVTEGTAASGKRKWTISPMHFVDEHFEDEGKRCGAVSRDTSRRHTIWKRLRKSMYMEMAAAWIKNGLNCFVQTEHVLDGFHLEKYLKRICVRFPQKNLRVRFHKAFEQKDRKKAETMIQELYADAEGDSKRTKAVKEFGSYILNNWEEIVRRKTLNIPGSCTEGQVSHVLSREVQQRSDWVE